MSDDDRQSKSEAALRIIYIGGWMRSGTTLLCEMVGAFRHVVPVGELSGIWRAADRDEPCSCGESILACPVWGSALRAVEAKHGVSRGDYAEWAQRARRVLKSRSAWSLARLSPGEPATWPPRVREYVEVMDTLLRSVQDITDAVALVDSSKLAPSYLMDRLLPGVRVDLLHIVRDPRAVANSERKTRIRSGPSADLLPPGRSVLQSVLFWSGFNLTVRMFARSVDSYYRLDYASLTRSPDTQLDEIARHLGLQRTAGLTLDAGHIAVGNPARLGGPGRSVVPDDSWKVELPRRTSWFVAIASFPARMALGAARPHPCGEAAGGRFARSPLSRTRAGS